MLTTDAECMEILFKVYRKLIFFRTKNIYNIMQFAIIRLIFEGVIIKLRIGHWEIKVINFTNF